MDKAVIAIGLGHEALRKIPVDAGFRMRADALAGAIAEDRAAGRLPIAAVATVGTTSTTSIDPVPAIAEICSRESLWLHVDAAYGGAAAMLPTHAHVLAGADRADCGGAFFGKSRLRSSAVGAAHARGLAAKGSLLRDRLSPVSRVIDRH